MKHILADVAIEPSYLKRLEALPGVSVTQAPFASKPRELPAELLRDKQILLCKHPPVNFDDLQSLEMMQLVSVGYEHLRHLRMGERSVRVCNARGLFDTAIAEWCLGMMINLKRDIRGMIRHQDAGVWERSAAFQQEIRGKVLGLWGYGGIGRETARLARAFGLTIHVMTRNGIKPRENTYLVPGTGDPDGVLPDRVYLPAQKREMLSGLDFLVLALPHTRASDGLIGEEELRNLRPTAYLLNPARGPIVQEQALLRALREGWIAGAAIDTHYAYPMPKEHPLWYFPNVIMTPHISGADRSEAYPARIGELFLLNVERYLQGQPLLNELTKAEWEEV